MPALDIRAGHVVGPEISRHWIWESWRCGGTGDMPALDIRAWNVVGPEICRHWIWESWRCGGTGDIPALDIRAGDVVGQEICRHWILELEMWWDRRYAGTGYERAGDVVGPDQRYAGTGFFSKSLVILLTPAMRADFSPSMPRVDPGTDAERGRGCGLSRYLPAAGPGLIPWTMCEK